MSASLMLPKIPTSSSRSAGRRSEKLCTSPASAAADVESHARAFEVASGATGEIRIELDRGARDVAAPRVASGRDRDVGGITRAQRHDGQRSRWRGIEGLA